MTPCVFTIAAGEAFAETLARGLIETAGADKNPLALADTAIFLPTRRAVRTLGDTFARILGGAALLPQMRPLGAIDEDELFFDPATDDLALQPAITPIRRRLLLATLVERWSRARLGEAERPSFAHASLLARALAQFLDEAHTEGADLSKLEALAPAQLAEHWSDVRDFLVLLRDEWPRLLQAERAMEPADRRNRLLDALAERYSTGCARGPVIAAGTTGSIPATARLLAAIAAMPGGSVVLPGLDRDLDEESWNALDPGHPQYGLKELLARIGIARGDVRDWPGSRVGNPARLRLLSETLRPAPTTDAWRAIADAPADGARGRNAIARGLEGLSLIEAAHPGEEAFAIALVLREALETPGRTAALVTPDRTLARRVAAELGRWNIVIDDSAGTPLAHTPPGTFLLLLLETVAQDFAPVPLLALLKHPLAAGKMEVSQFRAMARALDLCLRGPRPDPGIEGVKRAIARAGAEEKLVKWFDTVAKCFSPLVAVYAATGCTITDIAEAHVNAAEALAADDRRSGADRLWRGDAGQAAAELFASLAEDARDIPPIEPTSYLPLLRTLIEERAVRPPYGRHPRLAILGPLEARLQSFDVVILGGLNEGTWPQAVAADPWLSRPMREKLGLQSPERVLGLAAHDFATLAAGPRVFLTRAMKSEGAPTVRSRWLQRLLQLAGGLGIAIEPANRYLAYTSLLELPKPYCPERRPAPKPPVEVRPRGLSVTEIETWLRDPYAIYAKHILQLKPLEPLDAEVGPLERGTAIHKILELFLKKWERGEPPRAEEEFVAIADEVFRENGFTHATLALWRPRFLMAARWFVGVERERRGLILRSHLETKGTLRFDSIGGEFVLRGRADRIDVLRTGGGTIIDYKSGNPPTKKQVEKLLRPQLPLEGAILGGGGFSDIGSLIPRELLYIQFGGGAEPGKLVEIPNVQALVEEARAKLSGRIALFDRKETPYLPRLIPFSKDDVGDYDHLARVREWSVSGLREDDE